MCVQQDVHYRPAGNVAGFRRQRDCRRSAGSSWVVGREPGISRELREYPRRIQRERSNQMAAKKGKKLGKAKSLKKVANTTIKKVY